MRGGFHSSHFYDVLSFVCTNPGPRPAHVVESTDERDKNKSLG